MSEMHYNFNLYNSIILAGLVQGLVFGIIVFMSNKYRVKSTRFLAALIIAFSLNNLTYYILDIEIITREQFFLYLYFPNALLSPPLMYSYVQSYLRPERKMSRTQYLLFLPFLLFMAGSLAYRLAFAVNYQNPAFYDFVFALRMAAEYCGIVLTLTVLIYLYRLIVRHEKNADPLAVTEGLSWLKWILGCLMLLCLVWIYEMAVAVIQGISRAFYMLWIGMSIMIYWMGHIGIYKFGVQQQRKMIRSYSIRTKMYHAADKQRSEHILALENKLIGEKRFLDPNVSLDTLSEDLSLSKSHLSRIINSELGTSFPDYLNSLRVEEAKRYLQTPEFSNYTLVAIGLEAGFNSKTTFNNAFKKATGQTPSQYRNSLTSNMQQVQIIDI